MADADDGTEERRGQGRTPIELRVEYKRFNTFLADYTKNISRGGTFIGTNKPLPVGTDFVFALSIPTLEEPLRLKGRVQWVTTRDDATTDSPAGMGIEFQYDGEAQRRQMEALVEQMVRRQLGPLVAEKLFG